MTFRSFILLFGLVVCGALRADDASSAFTEANRLYEQGDYAAAATAYQTLVDAENLSADLYYNLGAAKQKLGQSGEAALWMRRALHLEPGMPEAEQSLTFLRTRLAFFEFAGTWLDRTIAALPAAFGRWVSSLALWTGLLAIAGAFVAPRLRPNRSALITLGLVLLMASFVFSRVGRYREQRLSPSTFAIVTGDSVSALTAPTSDAKPVVALPPGSELRLLRITGPWTYAEIPGDLRGWVRTESVQPVWPIPSKNPS
jgi:tetratricopeptide (TPR) repeat protein